MTLEIMRSIFCDESSTDTLTGAFVSNLRWQSFLKATLINLQLAELTFLHLSSFIAALARSLGICNQVNYGDRVSTSPS